MDKYTLLNLINNPQNISENDIENLEEMALLHPYCQVVHFLTAKFAHDQASLLANQKVRRAACYAYNRNILRKLIFDKPSSFLPLAEEKITSTPLEHNFEEIKIESKVEENWVIESLPLSLKEEVIEVEKEEEEPDETRSFFEMIEDEAFNAHTKEVLTEPELEKTTPIAENFSIDSGDDFSQSNTPLSQESYFTEIPLNEKPSDPYFEDIDNQEVIPVLEEHPIYESINEGKALGLYYDGKVQEAIDMYQQLMEMYPHKKEYYESQLKELLGNKIYLYHIDFPSHSETKVEETVDISTSENTPEDTFIDNSYIADNQSINEEKSKPLNEIFPIDDNAQIVEESNHLVEDDSASFFEPVDYELPLQFFKAPIDEYNLAEEDPNAFFTKNPDLYRSDDHTDGLPQPVEDPFEQIHPIYTQKEESESLDFQSFTFEDDIIPSNQTTEIDTSSSQEVKSEQVIAEEPKVIVWDNVKNENSSLANENGQSSFFDEIESSMSEELNEERVYSIPNAETITEIDINPTADKITSEIIEEKTSQKIDLESAYITESQAIFLFNQGKNEEAIKIYEQLMARNPLKANYYENQINVLKGADLNKVKEAKLSDSATNLTDNEPNEGMALQFFTQGKTDEAIAIYEQLMAKHPEKSAYFASQIDILKS